MQYVENRPDRFGARVEPTWSPHRGTLPLTGPEAAGRPGVVVASPTVVASARGAGVPQGEKRGVAVAPTVPGPATGVPPKATRPGVPPVPRDAALLLQVPARASERSSENGIPSPRPRPAEPAPRAETTVPVATALPPETTTPETPVFVARSRFRLLWFRLAVCGVALAGVVFVAALVLSVVSGGVTPAATSAS